MNVSNATARGLPVAGVLRMLGFGVVALALATSSAMAAGSARASFTVGIRIVATSPPALTPEQLNERNKALYEEQKRLAGLGEEQKEPVDLDEPQEKTADGAAIGGSE